MNGTSRQAGFTFVELVVTVIVLGIIVSGILLAYVTTVQDSADPMRREQAIAIGEAYLDEILSKRFNDPDGADGEGARQNFDDVDDYDQINGEVPTDMNGNAIAGLGDYSVDVVVTGTSLNGLAAGAESLRVDVVVTFDGETITLSGFRANF